MCNELEKARHLEWVFLYNTSGGIKGPDSVWVGLCYRAQLGSPMCGGEVFEAEL